jgi:hypothetical protein
LALEVAVGFADVAWGRPEGEDDVAAFNVWTFRLQH